MRMLWDVSSSLCTTHDATETHVDLGGDLLHRRPPAKSGASASSHASVFDAPLACVYRVRCRAALKCLSFVSALPSPLPFILYEVYPLYGASSHLSAAHGIMDNREVQTL